MNTFKFGLLMLIATAVLYINAVAVNAAAKQPQKPDVSDRLSVHLGIIDEEASLSKERITRAEFCVFMVNTLTWKYPQTSISATRRIYSDIPQYDWFAGYAQYLSELGIINGYDDGTFRPDDDIELAQGYNIALKALGYNEYAELSGGYLDGVAKTVQRLNMDKSLSKYPLNTYMSGEIAAILIDNMLESKMLQYAGTDGKGGTRFTEEEIFVTGKLGLYEYKGIETGADTYSILGGRLKQDAVEFDGRFYDNMDPAAEKLIGCSVKYYVDKDSGAVHAIVPQNKNKILLLDDDEAYEYADGKIKCDTDGKTYSVKLSNNADIVSNGDAIRASDMHIPEYGILRLVDNDDDGSYDVVLITEYTTVIVDTIDTVQRIIYGKNSDSSGKRYEIKLDDYRYSRLFDASGIECELNSLKPDGVITAVISGTTSVDLYMSYETVAGVITNVNTDPDNKTKVTIDGTEYKVVYDAYSPYWYGTAGSQCTVSLDFNHNAAWIRPAKDDVWSFGYIFKASYSDDGESIVIRFLSQDGEEIRSEIDSKCRLDGAVIGNNTDFALSELNNRGLMRYRISSSGKLVAIDLPADQPMDDTSRSGDDNNNRLLRRAYDFFQYKGGINIFKRINSSNTIIKGEISPSDDAVIFSVPRDQSDFSTSDCKVIKRNALYTDEQCYVESFNTEPDMLLAQALVVYEDGTTINNNAKIFIIDKITETLYDDEETYQLEGYLGGNHVAYKLKSKELAYVSGNMLQIGDIIRINRLDDVISAVEAIYTSSGMGILNSRSKYEKPGGFDSGFRALIGNVKNNADGMFVLQYNPENPQTELYTASRFRIYVVDPEARTKVSRVTTGDIPHPVSGKASDETVIVTTSSTTPMDLVIYK